MRKYKWTCERDIVGGVKKQYIFSDGCGRMTTRVARDLAASLQLDYVPCVVQVHC